MKVLVLTDFFPTPIHPADGIFVERQAYHLKPWCDQVVVVSMRIFPPLRLWKYFPRPVRFLAEWKEWRNNIRQIPIAGEVNGLPTLYVPYTSLPKQLFQSSWGFCAYPFLKRTLIALHKKYHFDLIHAHWTVPSGVIAALAQRWMKVPIVVSVHGSEVTYVARKTLMGAAVVRWALLKASMVLANSTWTAREVLKYGVNPEKLKVVRLGGDVPKGSQCDSRSFGSEAMQLLTVGYLVKRKGHRFVVEALKILLGMGYLLEYIIVGDGPERNALETLVEELGLSNIVHFVGHIPHVDVWPYLSKCDILVLPSWAEAFGVVYIEALGLGKPVIGCAGEGGPEDLRALGDCVELVQPKDVPSLVAAIKCLLDDPARRKRMGEVGSEIVRQHYTWEQNAANTIAIYEKLVEPYKPMLTVCAERKSDNTAAQ